MSVTAWPPPHRPIPHPPQTRDLLPRSRPRRIPSAAKAAAPQHLPLLRARHRRTCACRPVPTHRGSTNRARKRVWNRGLEPRTAALPANLARWAIDPGPATSVRTAPTPARSRAARVSQIQRRTVQTANRRCSPSPPVRSPRVSEPGWTVPRRYGRRSTPSPWCPPMGRNLAMQAIRPLSTRSACCRWPHQRARRHRHDRIGPRTRRPSPAPTTTVPPRNLIRRTPTIRATVRCAVSN
ncbi:hypothetical protein NONI108955_27385 [Nocardia ninae]